MAKLVINPGTPQSREFQLKTGANYLGRGFANDVKIEDPSVSSSHAQIFVNGATVAVKDLGSTNGTFIDRAPVAEGVLQPGQSLRLGGVELLFDAGTESASAAIVIPPAPTGGLRISGHSPPQSPPPMVATAIAVPPPLSAPPTPPSPGQTLMDPPPGMTTCKYHPKAAGQWFCQKCNMLFCSLCVSTRRIEQGTGFFCRKCGEQCAPVRVRHVVSKEKSLKNYSDLTILMRAIGFGGAGALLAAVLWTGFAAVTSFDIPPIFCAATGPLCGYGVKIGCQDRPGVIFSMIAVIWCFLGVILGKIGMIIVTHNTIFGISNMAYGLFGLMVGFFLAWKFGGGDF